MNNENIENRRKEHRTVVNQNVYVVLKTTLEIMGQLIEISSTGMVFTFIDLEGISQHLNNVDKVQMDIFAEGKGYLLRNVSGRVVSMTQSLPSSVASSMIIMRIGVEFTGISVAQQIQINRLIRRQDYLK